MATDLDLIRKLEVPIIVQLGRKTMSLAEVMAFIPGAIIELPKRAEDELELMVNNRSIGTGVAVKVGENFGLQIEFVGDVRTRIEAMGEQRREARPLTMKEPVG